MFNVNITRLEVWVWRITLFVLSVVVLANVLNGTLQVLTNTQ